MGDGLISLILYGAHHASSGENVFANALCGGGSGGRAGDGDEGINGHSIDRQHKATTVWRFEKCMCVWKHSAGTNAYDGQVPEQQMHVAPGAHDGGEEE